MTKTRPQLPHARRARPWPQPSHTCDLEAIRCFPRSRTGIVPVRFEALHAAATAVDINTFAMANIWHLYPNLVVVHSTVEPMPGRSYPALSISTLVARKPTSYYTHVALPMGTLTALSHVHTPRTLFDNASLIITRPCVASVSRRGFMFVLDIQETGQRMTYSSTLLLTSATYKLFMVKA